MPKDYRLPNGGIIRNVPDDMPKHAIQMRAIREGLATNQEFGYETAESAAGDTKWDRFKEGMGRGAVETGRQIGNIFGFISDDELADAHKLDQDLLNTGMGMAGNIAGQVMATLPVSAGVGAAAKGLQAARGGAGAANLAGRTLASPMGRGAVEGAVISSLYAGPGERGEGALMGAAFGGVIGGAFQGLGHAWKNFKLTSMTPEAIALQKQTGQFIPLSQSGQGLTKMFYNGVLANLPGVSGKVRGQYKTAVDDLRHWAATKAHPDTPWAQISINAGDDMPTVMTKLDDFWAGNSSKGISGAYDEISDVVYTGVRPKVSKEIEQLLQKASQGTLKIPKGEASGAQLLNLKNRLNALKSEFTGDPHLGILVNKIDDALKNVDDIIIKGAPDDVAARYQQLAEPYANYVTLQNAVRKAGGSGEFTAPQLLRSAAKGKQGQLEALEESYLAVARNAAKALPDFPSREGIYQIIAATQVGGAIATAMTAGLATAGASLATIIGVGRVMASRRFQQVITGQHNMARLLDPKHHPWFVKSLKQAGLTTRQIAAIEAGMIASGEN